MRLSIVTATWLALTLGACEDGDLSVGQDGSVPLDASPAMDTGLSADALPPDAHAPGTDGGSFGPSEPASDESLFTGADAVVVGYFTGESRSAARAATASLDDGQQGVVKVVETFLRFTVVHHVAGITLPQTFEVQKRGGSAEGIVTDSQWEPPAANTLVGLPLAALYQPPIYSLLGPRLFPLTEAEVEAFGARVSAARAKLSGRDAAVPR